MLPFYCILIIFHPNREALSKLPKQTTPSPTVEYEDDMPVDFDPQIGEGDEYEVDEEFNDHAKQAHLESKQFVLLYNLR
jgi:hypothetical protein